MFDLDRYLRDSVCSFCGVILIARPQALFGGTQENPSEEVVTSGQRMISVTLGDLCSSRRYRTHRFHRAALIGVLGGTGSCESSTSRLVSLIHPPHRHTPPSYWKASACTSCSLLLRFAMCTDFHDRVRSAPFLASFLIGLLVLIQHDRIQGSPCDPNARVVDSHNVSHRHIRPDCAGSSLIASWAI